MTENAPTGIRMDSSNLQPISNEYFTTGKDDRWGDYIPWFFRYTAAPTGDFDTFFSRVSQRLYRFMTFNEGEINNQEHFGNRLETDSFQRYSHREGTPLGNQLRYFFDAVHIRQIVDARMSSDAEERRVQDVREHDRPRQFPDPMHPPPESEELRRARLAADETRAARREQHFRRIVVTVLGVLETILVDLHTVGARRDSLTDLTRDLRRALAESRIPLDIRGTPPAIIPIDDLLLQKNVIDVTLARVRARWPERAEELLSAYHDAISGRPLDEVFAAAFKSLEEIARSLTADPRFDLSPKALQRHFPDLHPTIRNTIENLRAHRGDAASHGRKGPNPNEIRYLLFHVCNIVLLLLDVAPEEGSHDGSVSITSQSGGRV